MKVCTDSCLFGAWIAHEIERKKISVKTILDIGTGTGLLSLMLAQKTNAIISAVEIDINSSEQADENFKRSPWLDRLRLFHADIKSWRAQHQYDLIVCNPPFYEDDLLPGDNGKNISKHSTALNFEELLIVVKKLIKYDGAFAILLPASRATFFETLAFKHSLFPEEKLEVKQTPSHTYFRTMFFFRTQKCKLSVNDLSIKDDKNEYTKEFTTLLKDYYLYL
jgi:tRNA1Val (adenine37-N6)-methyltransferase